MMMITEVVKSTHNVINVCCDFDTYVISVAHLSVPLLLPILQFPL